MTVAFTAEGLKSIGEIFKLCQPVTKKEKVKDLKDYLNDVWGNLAMMDYPYETSFLKPLLGLSRLHVRDSVTLLNHHPSPRRL